MFFVVVDVVFADGGGDGDGGVAVVVLVVAVAGVIIVVVRSFWVSGCEVFKGCNFGVSE